MILCFREGEVTDYCEAGFFCLSGSDSPTPDGAAPDPRSSCPQDSCAGPCPAGFFCPVGTEQPIACPEHTINMVEGGTNNTACQQCQPGVFMLCHCLFRHGYHFYK